MQWPRFRRAAAHIRRVPLGAVGGCDPAASAVMIAARPCVGDNMAGSPERIFSACREWAVWGWGEGPGSWGWMLIPIMVSIVWLPLLTAAIWALMQFGRGATGRGGSSPGVDARELARRAMRKVRLSESAPCRSWKASSRARHRKGPGTWNVTPSAG